MEKMSLPPKDNSQWWRDLFILLSLFAIFYLALIWIRPLASPDEGRYSEIPLEMIRSADYITPTLNDMAYLYKPPLYYWLSAGSIKIFGENLFGFRFANAAMALLGLAFTYCAARALYGKLTATFSTLILGTTLYYFVLGQVVTLDMTVSVFIAGAMFSFIVAIKRSGIWRGILILSFFISCALAVLAKGLIGVLIPAATIFLYAVAIGVPTFFKKLKLSDLWWSLTGLLLFFGIALPWHILAAWANPPYETAGGIFSKEWEGQGFFWYYIIHEHILRFIDPTTSDRAQPFWFFFVLAPIGFIPYVFFLPQILKGAFEGGYKKLRAENSEIIFFVIWVAFVILFFSVSSSKLLPYILPIYPAIAVIAGRWFAKTWETADFSKTKFSGRILVGAGYVAAIAMPIAYVIMERKGKLMEESSDMLILSICVSVLMALFTTITLYFFKKKNLRAFWKSVFLTVCVLLIMFNPMANYFQREDSQYLVEKISVSRRPDDVYIIAYSYNIFQDFPVWLGQTVYTIGDVPEEQKFGYMRAREKNDIRFINSKDEFNKVVAATKGNVYIAIRGDKIDILKREMNVNFVEVARERNMSLLKLEK